jgi:hypothetical protein
MRGRQGNQEDVDEEHCFLLSLLEVFEKFLR